MFPRSDDEMRAINPLVEISAIVVAAYILLIVSAFENKYSANNISLSSGPKESRWCDRYGWSMMDSEQCAALANGSPILPRDGTCPGAYDLFYYRKDKPPICVQSI